MGKPLTFVAVALVLTLMVLALMLWESGTERQKNITDLDVLRDKIAEIKEGN